MRPANPAARIRRATRSDSAITTASSSSGDRAARPSARWDPRERRPLPARTRRGSRLWAIAWTWRPVALPSSDISSARGSAASSPTVVSPTWWSFSAVASPMPHTRSTGSGCRNASSPPAGTTNSPSGLALRLAIFARTFVFAIPTLSGSPTCSRTRARSLTAISSGEPEIRSSPRTSRKASSSPSPSTTGEVSRNTSNTALLAST